MTPAPRILVVSGEQWPRALLRAQLDEAGYDAIGAGTLSRALRYPPDDAERGPVRLIVLDSGVAAAELAAVEDARRRYPGVAFVLVNAGVVRVVAVATGTRASGAAGHRATARTIQCPLRGEDSMNPASIRLMSIAPVLFHSPCPGPSGIFPATGSGGAAIGGAGVTALAAIRG